MAPKPDWVTEMQLARRQREYAQRVVDERNAIARRSGFVVRPATPPRDPEIETETEEKT